MLPGHFPVEVFPVHPSERRNLEQTQKMLKGLHIPSDLGTPWDPPGEFGGN